VYSFARSFQFLFNATDDVNIKGKVAVFEFPDKRLITNSSSISSLALINLTYRKIPVEAFTPELQNLVLENCLLSEVPTPVLDLKSLTLLNLASNFISTLPLELGNLPLTSLMVDDNELIEFPSFITKMASLKILTKEEQLDQRYDRRNVIALDPTHARLQQAHRLCRCVP
jgi:Leucine-rich repeat (LRR) protein